jgi:4-alpha-glucanotransferase
LADYGILSYRLFYFEKGADGLPKRTVEYPHQALVSSTTHDLPTLAGFWAGRDIDARKAVGHVSGDADFQKLKAERRAEKAKMLTALRREGLLPDSVPDEAADWDDLTGEIHNAVIGYLVSTPSMLMVLNQEDLTKELDQQNLPGTTWQYPNWRRKMRFTVEELRTLKTARDFSAMFRSWLERTGRLNAGPAVQVLQS